MSEVKENASIIYRADVGEHQCIVRIAPDEGELPEFVSGQYAELALPGMESRRSEAGQGKKLIRRAYSIASSPSVRNWYEFYIVLVPEGVLTPDLLLLPIGGRVWVGPKVKGKFSLAEVPEGKNVIAVASGTGIAPFVSMVRHHLNEPPWRHFTLIHGARREQDLGYYEELQTYAFSSDHFDYIPTVSREDAQPGKGIFNGRVQRILMDKQYEKVTGNVLTAEDCHVMLCGNPDMIDEVNALLQQQGFKEHKKKDPGTIHFERYW